MKIADRFFSVKHERNRLIITVLGIRIKIKQKKYYEQLRLEHEIQNKYDLQPIKSAKSMVVFLVPSANKTAGGIMSIFYLCELSRLLLYDSVCVIATMPGKLTYAKNDIFDNTEQVYRWEQVINKDSDVDELVIHVPECCVKRFYKDLTRNEINILKNVNSLTINILNQNIELMADSKYINKLFELTDDVRHSTGFARFTTQATCNKFGLPLYYIPSFINLENCVTREVQDKKKIILYSNDSNIHKDRIIEHLKANLNDFEIKEINGLTYKEFLEAVAEAMFCISFGEGFDGYYIQPYYAKSIGISVYNDMFFLSPLFKEFPFVYISYDDLYRNIVDDIKTTCANKLLYEERVSTTYEYLKQHINKKEASIIGLDNLYCNKPTFMPNKS